MSSPETVVEIDEHGTKIGLFFVLASYRDNEELMPFRHPELAAGFSSFAQAAAVAEAEFELREECESCLIIECGFSDGNFNGGVIAPRMVRKNLPLIPFDTKLLGTLSVSVSAMLTALLTNLPGASGRFTARTPTLPRPSRQAFVPFKRCQRTMERLLRRHQ